MDTLEQIDKKLKTKYYLTSKRTKEIHLGTSGVYVDSPEFQMVINGLQLDLLETISNTEIDSELNKVYVVNNLRFSLIPKLD